MTGPEHYRMAEALLKVADEGSVDWESTVATAQAHATLSLAAATALCGTDPDGSSYVGDMNAWHRAAGVKPASEEPQS